MAGSDKNDWETRVEELLSKQDVNKYLNAAPTGRHEAWFLMTALSNLALLKEVRGLRRELKALVKAGNYDKIKAEKTKASAKRKKLRI